MWTVHPRLYHKDTKGRLRVWFVEEENEKFRVFAGLEGAGQKLVAAEWTVCTSKNIGKANEVSPLEQCGKEITALYTKKLDGKYFRHPDCVGPKPTFPMLAQTYSGWNDAWDGPAFNIIKVYCQPKLNGIRCLAKRDGLWTRKGKPIVGQAHIMLALGPLFEAYPGLILDGELYNHELREDLGETLSQTRDGDSSVLQYHVYDWVSAQSYSNRMEFLRMLDRYTTLPIVRVQTHSVPTKLALDSLYGTYLKQGYEGQIIRDAYGFYDEGKRSKNLLKRKEFQDAEFRVVGFEVGKGNYAGLPKRVTLQLPDGREFGAGVKGNKAFLKELLDRTVTTATIKFFAYTPDGIPQFPVAIAFFEGERDV